MKEIWKDIKDYEGYYQISNLGRVKTLERITIIPNAKRLEKERILKLNERNNYKTIQLIKNNKRKSYQVHRLVAQAFIENPLNKPFINHKDYNTRNNRVENLEWCTQKENVNWSICNMKHRHKTNYSNTKNQYIYYRKSTDRYRIVIDKKEYKSCKTLEEAIKLRNKILKEGDENENVNYTK